jgi:hypothetical protein
MGGGILPMNGKKNCSVAVSECLMILMFLILGEFNPARLGIVFCDVHEDGNGEVNTFVAGHFLSITAKMPNICNIIQNCVVIAYSII